MLLSHDSEERYNPFMLRLDVDDAARHRIKVIEANCSSLSSLREHVSEPLPEKEMVSAAVHSDMNAGVGVTVVYL